MKPKAQICHLLLILAILAFICDIAIADNDPNVEKPNIENVEIHKLDGWVLGGGFCIVANKFDNYDEALQGPTMYLSRLNPGGIGFDFGLSYIMPAGFYHYKGLSASLELTYGLPVTPVTLLMLKGGAIACAGGDSDGSGGGGVGFSPGIGLMHRLAGPLTVSASIVKRIWIASGDFDMETFGARFGLSLML